LGIDGFLFTYPSTKGAMSDPSHQFSPPPKKERPKKGLDLPRAYHALIKGFVQVETARNLRNLEQKDEQGEQR